MNITGGARWYDYEVDFEGSANSSFCGMSGTDYNSFGTDINDLYDGDGSFTWIGNPGACSTLHEDKPVYTNDTLPDVDDPNYDRIVNSVNALRGGVDHLFTSGGIGPTHDDITADAVAAASGAHIDVRADALAILQVEYAERSPG